MQLKASLQRVYANFNNLQQRGGHQVRKGGHQKLQAEPGAHNIMCSWRNEYQMVVSWYEHFLLQHNNVGPTCM